MEPLVDVIVPVHTPTRPIARAVSSVVDHTRADVRVTVVAHNVDPDLIRERLWVYADHPRVRMMGLRDGIPSPAGPYNLGLAAATAATVCVLGSDDELQPGAIDSWLAIREATGADVVIGRIVYADGRAEPYPPVRWRRRNRLHPVHDRLFYRSAPLGLLDRSAFGGLRFAEGLGSGEDLVFVARLWTAGRRVSYARSGPAYLGHEDEGDRATSAPRSIAEDFAYLDELLETVERAGGRSMRRSVAAKLIRIHIFDAVVPRADRWTPEVQREIADVARRVMAWAPGAERYLSRVDREALDAVLADDGGIDPILDAFDRRWDPRNLETLVPRNPLLVLHTQSPLRINYHL